MTEGGRGITLLSGPLLNVKKPYAIGVEYNTRAFRGGLIGIDLHENIALRK